MDQNENKIIVTPEQNKKTNTVFWKYFFLSILNGAHHGLMICIVNIIISMIIHICDGPELLFYILAIIVAIFIFRRMNSVSNEQRDKFSEEIKKILNNK